MYTSSYSSNMGISAITFLPPFAIVVFLAYLRIASEPLIAGLVCVTFFACLWHGPSMKDCTRISATVYLVSPYYTNLDQRFPILDASVGLRHRDAPGHFIVPPTMIALKDIPTIRQLYRTNALNIAKTRRYPSVEAHLDRISLLCVDRVDFAL